MKTKKPLSQEKRQKIADKVLILTLCVQLLLLVNQSIGLYTTAAQSMHANIIEPTGEKIQVHIKTNTGRPSLAQKILQKARNWIGSYFVEGTQRTDAETGIIVAIDGTNIAATASVDYYIEARETTGQGTPYRFIEGNGTSVTVNGADLDLSNQTTIENHLTAMGLSTTSSWTIDYYVYVRASATGAISGESLISEITYQQFDSVTYQYGAEVSEDLDPTLDGYVMLFDSGSSMTNWNANENIVGMYFNGINRALWTFIIPAGGYTDADLHLYQYAWSGGENGIDLLLYSCDPFTSGNCTNWSSQPDSITLLDTVSLGSNGVGWREWDSSSLTSYVNNRAGKTAYFRIMIPLALEDHDTQFLQANLESMNSGRANDPYLRVTYISYSASWYPLPPLSLTNLPITLDIAALASLIFVTGYALRENRRKNR